MTGRNAVESSWLLKLCSYKLTREGRAKSGGLKGQVKVYISAYYRCSLFDSPTGKQQVSEFPLVLLAAFQHLDLDVRYGPTGAVGLEMVTQTQLQGHLKKCTKKKGGKK